jgi:hypothetical protein
VEALQSVGSGKNFIACGLKHGGPGDSDGRLVIDKKDTEAESWHEGSLGLRRWFAEQLYSSIAAAPACFWQLALVGGSRLRLDWKLQIS